MNLQAEKLELVQAILNIEDTNLIQEVKQLLKGRKKDWFDDLTNEQQKSVKRGLEQADRGETITHEDAVARLGL